MRVPGLFRSVRKYLHSEYEDIVVKLLFLTQDKGALKFLFDEWRSADLECSLFSLLHGHFCSQGIDYDVMAEFDRFLMSRTEEEERIQSARIIMGKRLGLRPPFTTREIHEKWQEEKKAWKKRSAHFVFRGADFLSHANITDRINCQKIGMNYRILEKGYLEVGEFPDFMQKGSFILRVRVLVIAGEGVTIGLGSEQGYWKASLSNGEWTVKRGDKVQLAQVPVRLGQWSEIEFDIDDQSTERIRYYRIASLSVDGKCLMRNGSLCGRMKEFFAKIRSGDVTIGGIEYIRR